jgi:AraC-like DNA-binding protein
VVLLDHGGRQASEATLVAPPRDLAGLVDHLWIQGDHGAETEWRVVADASPHLIACVTESGTGRRLGVGLIGARTRAASVDVTGRLLTVGVRLKAGVLSAITGESARAFVDRSVALEDVFPRAVLSDLELGSDSPPRVIALALVCLLRRLPRERARPLAADTARMATVRDLAASLGFAPRSLRDRVYRDVGLGPKRLLRLLRLHRALRTRWSRGLPWSAVAYVAGYADQAHLTREMQALLGETPSAWSARGSAVSFKTPGQEAT